ncbi:MAG: phage holin family protein [Corynebacterium sp.]|uniref:phage holin family protein n=1 Tax=unclassified Corynebacterium TaxID=2624378 RepID=UPI00264A2D5E|nr:phage holin family protein [Corynebacterium sp.]MDN5582055.1 phage holin family protein [Corynebacterium sp.]MDN5720262.1 phage holin family protein [Corynebacterium sp.]MDN6325836.1 phage holin family protein [Corynebacterium sp.]MDN6387525.1 phage holin family protein [Corynebacterium sp.]MDN6511552.1 phage holin family protein [Corynebacterium sp.]
MGFIWNFLVRAVGTALGLWVVTYFVTGVTVTAPSQPLVGDGSNDRLWVFLGCAAVILLLNMTVRPVLRLLGLPLTILTLGLFALVINAGVFLLAEILAQAVGLGLNIDSFSAAFWGAIIMALVSWVLGPITGMLSARR